MHVQSVVFIDAERSDISDHTAFHIAAQFTRYDTNVTIRVLAEGKELCCTCPAGQCWGWRYFREQWRRKFGE